MIWLAVVIFALTLIADRAYGQNLIEDEWESALEAHQGAVHPTHIYLPIQFRGLGGVEQWRALISAYFQPEQVDTMLCLMSYESGGDPSADNPVSSAAGLFQIIGFWWDIYGGDPYDPETNIALARTIWDQQGYAAWNPWNKGLCR